MKLGPDNSHKPGQQAQKQPRPIATQADMFNAMFFAMVLNRKQLK